MFGRFGVCSGSVRGQFGASLEPIWDGFGVGLGFEVGLGPIRDGFGVGLGPVRGGAAVRTQVWGKLVGRHVGRSTLHAIGSSKTEVQDTLCPVGVIVLSMLELIRIVWIQEP